MGLKLFGSSGRDYTPAAITAPNPNKFRFTVLRQMTAGTVSALFVRYPDCTNYGGLKCIVVQDYKENQKELDPHFLEGKQYKVLARFVPDETGWSQAVQFADTIARG